jgi:hypothetical protein
MCVDGDQRRESARALLLGDLLLSEGLKLMHDHLPFT